MISPDLESWVRDFWAGTAWHDTFPREIDQAAPLKLPLIIAKQAPINAQVARNWLQQRGIVFHYHMISETSTVVSSPAAATGSFL
jgi:acyl-CoA synthetase (AMP-forming)/AMP-acid ligase II